MNNFTLAHVLSTRRANTCAKRLLSSRVGLEAARDASMACKRSSTSSAARSPSEEFAKTQVMLNGLQTSQHLRQQ